MSALPIMNEQTEVAVMRDMANAIRFLSIDAVEAANSGHPGMPMGMADVATVLFRNHLKYDPAHPDWADRDRFVLSGGHGSMLLYSLLYLTGYEDITLDEIKRFRQFGAKTAGHPEYGMARGIETTTGPLGQGIGNAAGMALAEAMLSARFGGDVINHRTWVMAGDGDLMEGISHEVAAFAGHMKLKNLIVLFDDNGISIDGATSLSTSEDVNRRFESYGWVTKKIDGHNFDEINAAMAWAKLQKAPVLIACKTTIGFGAPNVAGTEKCHGAALGAKEVAATREALNWPHEPFKIPENIIINWREAGRRGAKEYTDWNKRFNAIPKDAQREFERVIGKQLPYGWPEVIADIKNRFIKDGKPVASRKASQAVLDVLSPVLPELVGGSADLTGSNGTLAKGMKPVTGDNMSGNYIHYGVREHGMAAMMNGMALHGGFVPYGGTFMVFTDYCKPAIRLAALMKQRVIFVMTHDSIGLGEDGPTHQPVEHLAALRATPNVLVLRPADAVETAECWALALANHTGPSVLVLTRQDLPTMRTEDVNDVNCSGQGGYILRDAAGGIPKVTLIATGSEVGIALDARARLEELGVPTRLVSMPSTNLFEKQGEVYRRNTLGQGALKVAIEAASPFGWDRYFGKYGFFIGMKTFGESAPYQELYKHFGITSDNIVAEVMARVGG